MEEKLQVVLLLQLFLSSWTQATIKPAGNPIVIY